GLELDDEVHALLDEVLGVAEGDLRLVAVVDDDQLDVLALGRPLQARVNLARERAVLSLARVADAVPTAPPHLRDDAVPALVDFLEQAAMMKRVQEAEAESLAEAGALHDVAQPEHLARRLERPENLGGVDDRSHDIRLAIGCRHASPPGPRHHGRFCVPRSITRASQTSVPAAGSRPAPLR